MATKTAVIFTVDGDFPIMFVVEGDYSDLDGIYVGQEYEDEVDIEQSRKLANLVYGDPDCDDHYEGSINYDDGKANVSSEALAQAIRDGAILIVCGISAIDGRGFGGC